MNTGVAVVRAGGSTKVEVKEKKDCIDDAKPSSIAVYTSYFLHGAGFATLELA